MSCHFLIVAMPGAGNLGDDLISSILVKKISEKYRKSKIAVLHYGNINEFGYPDDIEFLNYPRRNSVTEYFRRRSRIIKFLMLKPIIVVGGGGVFQDSHSPFTIWKYLKFSFYKNAKDLTVVCLGVGIGPIKRAWVKFLFRKMERRISLFQVRDKESYDFITNSEVLLGPDIVECEELITDIIGEKKSVSEPHLGCSIRPWEGVGTEEVASFIINQMSHHGLKKCVLFVFEYTKQNLEEYHLAIRLNEVLSKHGIDTVVLTYNKDSFEFLLDHFKCVRVAIAMRFHANILWQRLGIPVIPISYAPKVKLLYEENGAEAFGINLFKDDGFVEPQSISFTKRYEIPNILEQKPSKVNGVVGILLKIQSIFEQFYNLGNSAYLRMSR